MPSGPLAGVVRDLGLEEDEVIPYGRDKAKVVVDALHRRQGQRDGALVLVTGINPTSAGEGKTTTAIGLADGLRRLRRRAAVAIREPSMGPCFGVKGGGTGGGRAQVVPAEDINLHFTGDLHAVAAAHNLVASVVDNALFHRTVPELRPENVLWRRVLDTNDRALRQVVVGLGGGAHGVARETGFDITAASEVMAVLCLAEDRTDLKRRLSRMVVGEREDGSPVTVADLGVAGAAAALLRDAIHPNLVRTLEGTPAFVHGGPFGNIAHGCSSLLATRLALKCAEVVVTEAGFGTELGAEKFVHIKCRTGRLRPSVAVVVASVRALRVHGGAGKQAEEPDPAAVERGLANLDKHLENVRHLGMQPVVALNAFAADSRDEVRAVLRHCQDLGVPAAHFRGWELGSEGALELAEVVDELVRNRPEPTEPRYLYEPAWPLARKLEAVATTLYGAEGVDLSPRARARLARYEELGYGELAVCVAKTQYSLSDDPGRLGRPQGFRVTVRDARLAAGAGFVVVYTGDVLTMPGLPRHPAAERLDVDPTGRVVGLT
ncbi:MAG: formate--tetrahydrofolate ligase [Armatimonadota bacterium]|nr:formate--tetrahydrofolate ligase [Armatimonadota bacterium]MDR7389091.1 formate--tetrahydrofolate ligase [Armatimonadota bacterium]MDR7396686.1 formate--tetrahydrofolate ligase [Armatimonadota bacterium]MDR7398254.1 formate--tetrahydrofolate ligase [Armatimonadota bacterium]MDR7406052.1 formate--tetrahydrofolate ligase [Armatimonadota bacterium]